MRLLLIEVTTITILIKLQCCTAQLFPWSNLKQYFDQKTKHGPGNGGVLNINSDFNEGGGNIISFSADRPYRNTDSDTSFSNENESNGPISIYSGNLDTTTLKDTTKQVLKSNKKNNHKIALNFDNYPIQDQPYYDSKKVIETDDRNYKTVIPISQDSTVRPSYNIPNNKNVNVQISDKPASIYAENDNYDTQNQDTIVITQKPIVIHQHADEKSQNSRISHKTVSIIPSVNVKTQSLIENDNRPIYVTSRPYNYPVAKSRRVKIKELSSTHRPVKQTTLSVFRPRPEYHSLQNDNNPIFLPTVPPSVTVLPKVAVQQSSPSLNTQYGNIEPLNGQKSKLYVETVPSLAITIKASGNKPFRITDGNSGLVDYLIPPPPPSVQSTKTKILRSPLHITKQKRKPYQSIKEPSLLTENSNSYINTEDEIKIIDEMSKLKPPEKAVEKNINSNKKLINDKKLQNYLNLLKQQQQQLEEQNQYDDSAMVYESVKNVRQQRLPHKKSQRNSARNQKRSKYHNHRMTSDEQLQRNTDDNDDYESKEDKSDNQNTAAASHVNEQITSETGYSEPHSSGDRVEFQMHGQNGPKSYKFGFDTGKGHNRQFRFEERDKDGHVKGHYGYYDKEGKLQVVNYEADPHTGFKADPVPV